MTPENTVDRCEFCNTPVTVVGDTTKHYESDYDRVCAELERERAMLDEAIYLLTQIQSQMCWESDRDELTMGFADLHTPTTKLIAKLKAHREEW